MSKSIAERIEALEGACRKMDREIAKLTHGASWKMHADTYYTASLDAAMSLVPDTTDVTLGRVWCSHRFAHITDGETTWSGKATTEALALCAAALRAQEATNG